MFGFFDNSYDAVAAQFGDPVLPGISHLFEVHPSAALLFGERFHPFSDVFLDDVVAEHDDDLLALGEMFGQPEGIGNPTFAFLVGIVDVRQAKGFPVAEQAQEIAGVFCHRLRSADRECQRPQGLNRIENQRLVIDGQQMLVGDFREWM